MFKARAPNYSGEASQESDFMLFQRDRSEHEPMQATWDLKNVDPCDARET